MNPTADTPAVATGMEAITTAVKTALATVSTDAQALKEDLSIGNGNYVCRDICGYVTCLCLNDRQCGDRTSAQFIV